ncbi:hypothetical protein WJX72_003242 [[Myrmecia] bisecta]|uniref:Uncharacterized protein n=1 Tax=[Myrmecia] bisecta TaxID=41462 RepID=A0AAW1P1N6_9CHLO
MTKVDLAYLLACIGILLAGLPQAGCQGPILTVPARPPAGPPAPTANYKPQEIGAGKTALLIIGGACALNLAFMAIIARMLWTRCLRHRQAHPSWARDVEHNVTEGPPEGGLSHIVRITPALVLHPNNEIMYGLKQGTPSTAPAKQQGLASEGFCNPFYMASAALHPPPGCAADANLTPAPQRPMESRRGLEQQHASGG